MSAVTMSAAVREPATNRPRLSYTTGAMNMFKPTAAKTPEEYIDLISEPRRSEIQKIDAFIRKTVPDLQPFIVSGMIGYGPYRYKTASGREGDWAVVLLASQKNYISIYACGVVDGKYVAERYGEALPKANIGKSCIRIKKASDIDYDVLKSILLECEKSPMGKA